MKLQLSTLLSASTALAAVLATHENQQHIGSDGLSSSDAELYAPFACDLPPAVTPDADGLPSADALFSTKKALGKQIGRHAAIVGIPTVGYDDNGEVDEDPRWLVFFELHKLLKRLFPTVHKRMDLVKVNRFGLVFTINGTEPSLKPIMLTAHQDVVPVADASTWTYPPFSGHYDGKYLWGRGSCDDKNSLTAVMTTLESLLSNKDWAPRRTIILAFGFDEESSGKRGAGTIGPYLEERYGKNSMALIVDEGGLGLNAVGNDTLYALPGVFEKGHVDVLYELHVQGGHSSMPFAHTGIGIMSEIVTALESNPYTPKLIHNSPMHKHLICQTRYSPDADPLVSDLIKKDDLQTLAKELAARNPIDQFRLQTSQAVDMIFGGVKINAMPELITLGVNYRVAPQDSIAGVKAKTVKLVEPILKKYGVTLKAFGAAAVSYARESDNVSPSYEVDYNGTLVLSTRQETELAPESPTSGPIWDLFSGSIQHTFAFEGGKVVTVGDLMNGNTDTRHYLSLTPNVYRFLPVRPGTNLNFHTIDERVDMENQMETIKFYYDLIRNFDASDA